MARTGVVPSPLPLEIPDIKVIRILLDNGAVVISGGRGGIPVVRRPDGTHYGVEAVIDKDRASAMLASRLGAEALLFLTDVPAVFEGFGSDHARPLQTLTAKQAKALKLPDGSMRPKVEAAFDFLKPSDAQVAIGCLEDAAKLVEGTTGTRMIPE